MPTYTYNCPACGSAFERILPVSRYREPQDCVCGALATKVILFAPAIRADYAGYDCPVTGKRIEGRRAHEENLRRQGCHVLEPGETDAARQRATAEEAALDASVDDTVDRFITSLPTCKREQLVSEVEAGASATVVRQ